MKIFSLLLILHPAVPKYDFHIIKIVHHNLHDLPRVYNEPTQKSGSSMAERLGHWTGNLEAPSLDPT